MAQKAQIFQTLLAGLRFDGIDLAGGKVYFYSPGTTTAKAVYIDRDKTTEAANPYTLDANGQAEIYGDGVYDIKVTTTAGVEKAYWYNVSMIDPVAYGVDATAYSSLAAAVSAIGATNAELNISNNQSVTSNLTIPSNIELIVRKGGMLSISNGATLTINGQFQCGLFKCFDGAGSVVFGSGSVEAVYLEWYGAIGNGINDDHAAMQKAMFSPPLCPIVLTKNFYIGDIVYFDSNLILHGNGNSIIALSTFSKVSYMLHSLRADASGYDGVSNIYIKDVTFDASDTSAGGQIGICHGRDIIIKNCTFNGCSSIVHHIDLPGVRNVLVDGCLFTNKRTGTSLQIDGADTGSIGDFTYETFNADRTRSLDVTITNCKFYSIENSAVHLHKNGHKRVTVIGNMFIDCQNALVDDDNYPGIAGNAEIIFSNNEIRSNDAALSYNQGNGVNLISGVTDVIISNNNFNTYYWPVVILQNVDSSITNNGVIISGNTFRSTARGCVYAYKLQKSIISDNFMATFNIDYSGVQLVNPLETKVSRNVIEGLGTTGTSTGTGGVYCTNAQRINISENNIKGVYDAISVGALSGTVQDLISVNSNNIVSSLGAAINVYGDGSDQVQNCIIANNNINGTSCKGGGIVLTNGRRFSVSSNIVTGVLSGTKAIFLSSCAQGAANSNSIYGDSATNTTGIEITVGGQCSVVGNTMGNLQYGIVESSGSGNTIAIGNVLAGVTTDFTLGTGSSQANNITI